MIANVWKELSPGPAPPNVVHVIVEIPRGQRNKYEYDKKTGILRLNRVLYSSIHYPGDYGLIPQTYYDDGDPLDILVMINEPTFPGCIIPARPIGLFRMLDGEERDDKVLAVPINDPMYKDYNDISDIPAHYLDEVAHFFQVYKDLEGGRVTPLGWSPVDVAHQQINHAIDLYQELHGVSEEESLAQAT